jgi:hypothetical protein
MYKVSQSIPPPSSPKPKAADLAANPCLACTIAQGCCAEMQGLMVTETEYERVFARHQTALEVSQTGRLKRLTSKAGPCPNWQGACTVYADRPMECRLFPFTVSVVAATDKTVHITVHDRVDCPQKDALRPREAVARGLIEAFARDAYGPELAIRISFERGLGRLKALLLRLGLRLRWFRI